MFGSRLTKIIRDITARKVRTALVALSVFVGVLGVVVVSVMGQLVSRQLEKDIHTNELAMLRIFVDLPSNTSVDNAAVLRQLRDYPGVTAVEGQAVYEFQWKRAGELNFRTGELYAYSEPFEQITLEPVRLLSGAYPVDGQNEIAIEQRMATRYHLSIGDTITVRVDGTGERDVHISGIIFQPYLYVGGSDGSSSAYATYTDAQAIVGFTGYSSFFARFKDWQTSRQESHNFRRELNNQTPYEIVFYLLNDPDHNLFVVGVRQSARVLTILAVIALVVSSFVVTDVIGSVIAEQRKQIGAMKALGATRWDVLAIYLGMALMYGLLGSIPAMIVGVPLGQRAAESIAPAANAYLQDTSPPVTSLLLGGALGLVVPVLAAFVPIYNGTRVTILEAMTDQGISATYGRGLMPSLVRVLDLPPLLFQSVNNILQHKARLALSFTTLMLSAAAFMGILAVYDTLHGVVGSIESTFNYQISFDPSNIEVMDLLRSVLTEEQIREIKPGVAIQLQAQLDSPAPDFDLKQQFLSEGIAAGRSVRDRPQHPYRSVECRAGRRHRLAGRPRPRRDRDHAAHGGDVRQIRGRYAAPHRTGKQRRFRDHRHRGVPDRNRVHGITAVGRFCRIDPRCADPQCLLGTGARPRARRSDQPVWGYADLGFGH